MKRILCAGFALAALIFIAGCQSTTSSVAVSANVSEQGSLEKMKTYLVNAGQKMDEMAVAEAITQYVAVLAVRDELTRPSQEALDLAARAETMLTKIEAGCFLQAGTEWLNADAAQMVASTTGSSQGDVQSPKVTLFYNVGGSRIAVSTAPIVFTVKQGPAQINGTGMTKTNEYGEASIPPPKVLDATREIVIHAAVVFTSGVYQYQFKQTKLDLVYRPPLKRAVILVYERDDQGQANDNPFVLEPVLSSLKKMDFDFSQYNGKLLGDNFMKVYNGDLQSIKTMTLDQNVPYLVMVLNDCYSVRQQGKFNIYVSEGKASLNIIRVADGKILFQAVGFADRKHDTHGQHNSHDTAVSDVYKRAAVELVKELGSKSKEINQALGIGP